MSWIRSKALQVVISVFIIILVIFGAGLTPVNKQGFLCDDPSIGYPVLKETMSAKLIYAIGLIFIPAFIVSVETLAPIGWLRRPTFTSEVRCSRLLHVFLAYWCGTMCFVIIACSLKHAVGELRPNFLDICKPDFSKINCSQGYITEYNCTSDVHLAALKDAYRSFPSGHSASIFYATTFLILYLRSYMEGCPTPLVAAIVNASLVIYAVFGSFTRIIDRQHHWWDVVFGAIIGITTGIYVAFVILFKNDVTDAATTGGEEDNKSIEMRESREVAISFQAVSATHHFDNESS